MPTNLTPDQARAFAQQATVYGYPMVANYRTMYYSTQPSAAGFNILVNQQQLCTPEDTLVVTPNNDTLYSKGWLDLRAEPMVLSVPPVEDRYYSFQVIDLFTNNIFYIGTRETGTGPARFLFAGPDWQKVPVHGIPDRNLIQTTSQILFLLGRTEVGRLEDLNLVHGIQEQYHLQTLSNYLENPIQPPVPMLQLPPIPLEDVRDLSFFIYLNLCLSLQNPPSSDAQLMQRFAQIDVGPDMTFNADDFNEDIQTAMLEGIQEGYAQFEAQALAGYLQNGWKMPNVNMPYFGTSWADYEFRAMMAFVGLYVNTPVEAVYPMGNCDVNDLPLDGANGKAYELTFPANEWPPAIYFWSVTMYDADTKLLVANPLNRYSIGKQIWSGREGTNLTIEMRHIETATPDDQNDPFLLPAPDGPFYVVLRIYGPEPSVLESTYRVPGIMPVTD